MNRHEFEALRDLPGKRIRHQTITLTLRNELSPLLTADNVVVENSLGKDIRLNVTYNPETDSKVVNVQVAGTGPICRLCVDATPHKPCGRSHKHSLQAIGARSEIFLTELLIGAILLAKILPRFSESSASWHR